MDIKKLMEMMEKGPKPKKLGESDLKAKMEVLKELHQMATQKAGESVKEGLSKVTVAAPDKEGLKEGMEKAQELLESPEELDPEMEMVEESEEESEEVNEEESEDEKKKKLKELLGL